jgi:uncharacterized protein (TIGR02001 family)
MNSLLKSLIIAVAISLSQAARAELSGSLSLVSDYRARGISQSGEDPAIQAWIEYFHDSGFYTGWWASNLDYYSSSDPFDNKERAEHDFYIGYFRQVGENLSYDLTYYEYFLPGAESNVDFSEIALGVDYHSLRVVYWTTNDAFNTGEDYKYIEADYRVSLPKEFGLTFHLGYSFGNALDLALFGFKEYLDYALTVDKSVAGLDVSIGYSDTNIDGNFVVNSDYNANQNALVFSLTKKF